MTLDEILDKHLPDRALCNAGKRLNRARKVNLRADLLKWQEGQKVSNEPVDQELSVIVDEIQLGLINAKPNLAVVGDNGGEEIIKT